MPWTDIFAGAKGLLDSVSILAVLLTVYKGSHELRLSRTQREEQLRKAELELRFRKLEMARQLLAALQVDQRAQAALLMIDWEGREFEIEQGRREPIGDEDVRGGLRSHTDGGAFNNKEAYIRDCFDSLFTHASMLERALHRDLIEFDDLRDTLVYYLKRGQDRFGREFDIYLKTYGFEDAARFIRRFSEQHEASVPELPDTVKV